MTTPLTVAELHVVRTPSIIHITAHPWSVVVAVSWIVVVVVLSWLLYPRHGRRTTAALQGHVQFHVHSPTAALQSTTSSCGMAIPSGAAVCGPTPRVVPLRGHTGPSVTASHSSVGQLDVGPDEKRKGS